MITEKPNFFYIFLIIFITLLAELIFPTKLYIKNAEPNLILTLVIFFGLFYTPQVGFETGIFAGFLKDMVGIRYFGINILIYGFLGFFFGFIQDKIFRENFLTQFTAAFTASYFISKADLSCAFYSAAVAPFFIYILRVSCRHILLSDIVQKYFL